MNAVAQQEKNTNTQRVSRPETYMTPDVNIFETAEGYVLEAEMPGVNKNGLEVTLEGDTLTIEGRRQEESVNGSLIYRESRPAHFRRVFELDPAIDVGKIKAEMEAGLLTLTLPKTEKVKPRKIRID